MLLGIQDSYAVALKAALVDRAVVTVSGKAVSAVDQYRVKGFAVAVCNHLLERFAVFSSLAGDRAVDVFLDHSQTVRFGVSIALAELPFNRLLILALRTVSGVNNCFHGEIPP